MRQIKLLSLFIISILTVIPNNTVHAQQSLKCKTLCTTWMAETIEAHIGFPLDTTIIVYSRASGRDTNGYSKFRMTFLSNGCYSSISNKGVQSKYISKWELSDDESKLIIQNQKNKKIVYSMHRLNPNYLEISTKRKGINTVLKMVPEK